MLDYLSTYPFPGAKEGTKDVLRDLKYSINDFEKEYNISETKLSNIIVEFIEKDNPQYSYAGWVTSGRKEYAEKIKLFLEKRKQTRKKILNIIKSVTIIYLCYKDTVDRFYKPGGNYESYMSMKWNPILMQKHLYENNLLLPPIPPKT